MILKMGSATIASKRMFIICVIIVGLALLFDIFGKTIQQEEVSLTMLFISASIYVIFLSATIVILMRNMFKSRKITQEIIVGGICIYLLMGILWAISFGLLIELDGDALAYEGLSSLYYFSFTTLTTLGYGDITPRSDFARVLTTMEAVIGQLYLAVFVARLVGLHIAGELRYPENTKHIGKSPCRGEEKRY